MNNIGLILSIVIGIGYCFLTISNSSRQKDKYYYKLFNEKIFSIHIIGALLIGTFGLWRVINFDNREFFYFNPLIYLMLLRLLNYLSLFIYKRPLILATRWDSPPKGKNGIKFFDKCMLFLLLLIPTGVSLFLLKLILEGV
ncbi:hypothetical protein TH63_04355 [Rufibacter radiotolerans]|uniref:Uncharacterized protein n=1 Tax=Rufibacter radiotolerans TaxID=1379910 RepID=A0A0H4VMB9_9BACT|nr:hypothetical protein TH63_04355 [Rufibacter radiotolerans]